MKRILAVTLSIVIVFSLCACGNNKKAEKYCSSCGEGISKVATFCEHCGAAVNNERTESKDTTSVNYSSAEAKIEGTSKPSSGTKPNTSKQSTPTHTHSYSKKATAATCTQKGYTTYTCSCGDTYKDDYINPSHTYKEFICSFCGTIDKENAYKHLVEYIQSNGKVNGSYKSLTMRESDNEEYKLEYDAQSKEVLVTFTQLYQGDVFASVLSVKDGSYAITHIHSSSFTSELSGFIDPKTFNENSAITYEVYKGFDDGKTTFLNLIRSNLVLMLLEMETYFNIHNINLNIYSLGYMSVLK